MSHKDYKADLLRLMQKHPELPVIPMVGVEVVDMASDGDFCRYAASIGKSRIDSVYLGENGIHFASEDDWYDVLPDMQGCKSGYLPDGREIESLSDEEGERIYDSLPWFTAIVINIDEYGAE